MRKTLCLICLFAVAVQAAAESLPASDGASPRCAAVRFSGAVNRQIPRLGSLTAGDLSSLPRWIVKWSPMGLWDPQLLHLTFSAEYRPAGSNLSFGLEGAYLKESLYRQNQFYLKEDLKPQEGFMLRPFVRLYLQSPKPGSFTFIEFLPFYKYTPFRFYSWSYYNVQNPPNFYSSYQALDYIRRSYGFILNAGIARTGVHKRLPGWWAELYGGVGLRNRELFFRDLPAGLYLGDNPKDNIDLTWRQVGLAPTLHLGARVGLGRWGSRPVNP